MYLYHYQFDVRQSIQEIFEHFLVMIKKNPFQHYLFVKTSHHDKVKLIYSEKATKFCKIFSLLLTVFTVVKSKGKISQNFVAFAENMNFE